MTQREKIIVGLMLLTVAYGIYALFFEGKGKSAATEPASVSSAVQLENLNAFILKVAEASKAGLSNEDKYIISRAETEWKQDPMMSAELTDRPQEEIKKQKQVVQAASPRPSITYTGFMQMGDRRFAIINGFEYAPGDQLADGTYKISSVTPSQVVIVSTDGSNKKFIFPLEE
ncbi:MAG: hypothetical protein JRF36_04095 [Deltaproteobacteria bacterium]|jgi:hypothetical protein|nr:hypothetical protein [Deltaproteobacteria bacterium]